MSFDLLAVALLFLFVGSYCFLLYRRQCKLDAEWEERYPRSKFAYCGRTVIFYEPSHGNQVEYLDSDGYCYLWYPENTRIVVGRWRSDDSYIYFRYGFNTFNPVTGIVGGRWEPCPIDGWSTAIVEDFPNDPLGITKRIPFVLMRHPQCCMRMLQLLKR